MKKLTELLGNEEFIEKIKGIDSKEQFLSLLSDNGVYISEEALDQFVDKLAEDKELTEEDLQDISGGWAWTVITNGSKILIDALKCNKHTNWGRNGKKCICGYHFFLK